MVRLMESEVNITPSQELIKLISEHPELPIVPMVDADCICDDCGKWLAKFDYPMVGKYIVSDERVFFDDNEIGDDIDDVISAVIGRDKCDEMTEEEMNKAYEELEWIDAIIVNINPC